MPVEVLVVAESAADARIVTGLCEREIQEGNHGFNVFDWETERRYCGIEPGTDFAPWSRIPGIITASHPRFRKFAWGKGRGRPDYAAALKVLALIFLARDRSRPDFILFSRDTDNKTARWASLRDLKEDYSDQIPILLAVQHPKIEAWLLNGFEPGNEAERKRLEEVKSQLGFDPTTQAERLTAQGVKGKRNAKRVLAALTADDGERLDRCWKRTSLTRLRERGRKTGLSEFLDQIDSA